MMRGFWAALAVCAALGAGLLTAVCVCAKRKRTVRPADCLIVLGARVYPDGSMSNTLWYRCERALQAREEGVAGAVIVCGGRGADEPAAEAELMLRWLLARGVPEAELVAEAESANTRANLCNAQRIMNQRGWRSAAIVTSDYHLERALWISRELGMQAGGIAAKSPRGGWSWLAARIRESVSWVLYGVRRLL